jgi:hypothetical protein
MKFHFAWILFVLVTVFIIYLWTMAEQRRDLFFHYNLVDDPESSAKHQINLRKQKDTIFLYKIFALGSIIILWQGIWNPTQQFNLETTESTKQYSAYISQYNTGWNDQCAAVFSRVANTGEQLYGKNLRMAYGACESLKPADAAELAFDKYIGGYIKNSSELEIGNEGRDQANSDALDRIFYLSPYWCWRTECVTIKSFDITK